MNETEKAAHWREQIDLCRGSGLTMKAWCVQQSIPPGQMKYWIRKLGLRQRRRTAAAPTWIPVTPEASSSAKLVVQVGTATIEVTPGFDAKLLHHVVRALADTP